MTCIIITMKREIVNICCCLFVFGAFFAFVFAEDTSDNVMAKSEREELKEEARDMFYHAYRAYMENAYPADELMPLSCKGRYRGVAPNRGDMDDILGNFSLTLVDSLDTLVILEDFEEFEHAVKLVIKDVSFDRNIVVSVFETNIRMLGGLLSAHILATGLQESGEYLTWYRGELLDLAHDLGKRLLPAFNTSTGIPHAKVNLRNGMRGIENSRETCTACAGTMILEMAALSRLTGEPVFEKKAHEAMDKLWKIRHRTSDLMGTTVNVHSGDWIRKDSGVGAGIDSYYEYCFKAYILLGDETYLARFYRHYNAVMKYISRGPMLFDVHMHRPHTQARHFMDALLAFWPGLQVLLGDVQPAVETHEMLYQVMQRHTFLPEAFTADFQVHWGQHPLRPEFLESTYFLHRATGDDHYLQVGKAVLKSLQKHARVPCGYAAMNDVRTRVHEDRMDSFVLAETFKYLYILFADDAELPINLDDYLLTTEAHLLPLTLADYNRNTTIDKGHIDDDNSSYQYSRTCPNTLKFLPRRVRKTLKDKIRNQQAFRRMSAQQFRPSDPEHIRNLAEMGISVLTLDDGRLQLLHTFSTARSAQDAEEGLIFMREMAEMSGKMTGEVEGSPGAVAIQSNGAVKILPAGPAHFGPELQGSTRVSASVTFATPAKACSPLVDTSNKYKGKIVIAERGDCTFADKVRRIQKKEAVGVIIVDNIPGSSQIHSPLFAMFGDGEDDIFIPAVFLYSQDAEVLTHHLMEDPKLEVILGDKTAIEQDFKDVIIQKNDPFRVINTLKLQLSDSCSKETPEKIVVDTTKDEQVLQIVKPDPNAESKEKKSEKPVQNSGIWEPEVVSEFEYQVYIPVDQTVAGFKKEADKLNSQLVAKILEEMKARLNTMQAISLGKMFNTELSSSSQDTEAHDSTQETDRQFIEQIEQVSESSENIDQVNQPIDKSKELPSTQSSDELDIIALIKHSKRDDLTSNRIYHDNPRKARMYVNTDLYKSLVAEQIKAEKAAANVKLQRVEIDPKLVELVTSQSYIEGHRDRPHKVILMESKFDLLKDCKKPISLDCESDEAKKSTQSSDISANDKGFKEIEPK